MSADTKARTRSRQRRLLKWTILAVVFGIVQLGSLQFQKESIPRFHKDRFFGLRSGSDTIQVSGPPQIWLQMTFSVKHDQEIMGHALHHYIHNLKQDPDFVLIALHHPPLQDDKNASERGLHLQTEDRLRQEFGIQRFLHWTGEYSSDELWKARARHRAIMMKAKREDGLPGILQPCDWIVKSDADEFLQLPPNFSSIAEMLKYVGNNGYDSVFGYFADRVALDGGLPAIQPLESSKIPLSEQFPWTCRLTEIIIKTAFIEKVVAFRAHHQENRGGHALIDHVHQGALRFRTRFGRKHCGYPIMLPIDHYKWTAPVVEKLKQRAKKYIELKLHFQESLSILDYLKENNDHVIIDDLDCFKGNGKKTNHTKRDVPEFVTGVSCDELPMNCPAY